MTVAEGRVFSRFREKQNAGQGKHRKEAGCRGISVCRGEGVGMGFALQMKRDICLI